jgi:hypothetical protein
MATDYQAEIGRVISALQSLVRGEVDDCERAIRNGDLDRARREITDVEDKLKRAISALNRIRISG